MTLFSEVHLTVNDFIQKSLIIPDFTHPHINIHTLEVDEIRLRDVKGVNRETFVVRERLRKDTSTNVIKKIYHGEMVHPK